MPDPKTKRPVDPHREAEIERLRKYYATQLHLHGLKPRLKKKKASAK